MKSLSFPNILSDTNVNMESDHEATINNLMLVLMSAKGELLGDPGFGCNLRKLMFDQNDTVLRDIVIDDIYSTIQQFVPQLNINRSDITILQSDRHIAINIKAVNLIDYQTDMLNINLLGSSES